MKPIEKLFIFLLTFLSIDTVQAQVSPDQLLFVRQAARRIVFDNEHSILLSTLRPESVVGMDVMHPAWFDLLQKPYISQQQGSLVVRSEEMTQSAIWLGGFNPFATYIVEVSSFTGSGLVGIEFTNTDRQERIQIFEKFKGAGVTDVRLKIIRNEKVVADTSIATGKQVNVQAKHRLILQMLGSGLVVYAQSESLPEVIAQVDFNNYIDLRYKKYLHAYHSNLLVGTAGEVILKRADISLTTGTGLADIRPITYENGEPMLDQGRLWYTMSIRGRALPHHLQGIFSLNPTTFDLKFQGILVFDRNDGMLRNEVASHLFYDRRDKVWKGVTTGFSAYANPAKEKKQLLIAEGKQDPRFGFSVMNARPFQMVGDLEDPQILFDAEAKKWRMIACKNDQGYKAILFESDKWDQNYRQIAGPVKHNSTGTSLQRINGKLYCFSGSSANKIFIYSYPDLKEAGVLKMDLPPWSETSGSRVWPNVIQLPEGYPSKYIALMMDRFNYPGIQGPNWTYGALYYYHGYEVLEK